MISISNAIPIQFWLNGLPVFNEKIEDGIEAQPFYQKFNASDDVKLQFTDTELKNYKLKIFDCDDELITTLDFTSVLVEEEYVYSLEFTFEAQGVTEQGVRVQIVQFEYSYELSAGITDLMDEVSGNVTFTPAALIFEISGDVEDLMDEVGGSIEILTLIGLTNNSLDISITDVLVGGVSADVVSGSLPLGPGIGSVTLSTKQSGIHDIVVVYTSSIAGQHITLGDSDGNIFCQSNGASPNTYSGCVVNPGFNIGIDAADGVCPP